MAHVLWPTTWGYFLDQIMQPLVDDGAEAAVRTHFAVTCAVAGRCPRSASVASPTACSRWSLPRPGGGRPVAQAIGNREERSRGLGPRRRDHARAGGRKPARAELVRLLRMTPRSKNFRTRQAIGAAVVSAGTGFELLAPFQELSAQVTLGLAGIEDRPRLVDLTLASAHLVTTRCARRLRTSCLRPNRWTRTTSPSSPRRSRAETSLTTADQPFPSFCRGRGCFVAPLEVADAAVELVLNFELAQGTLEEAGRLRYRCRRRLHGIDPAEPVVTDAAEQSYSARSRGRSSWPS